MLDNKNSLEKGIFDRFNKAKTRILSPFLKILTSLGITADMLTLFALVVGFLSAVFLILDPQTFMILLMLHMILDNLDGSLARYTKTMSKKGVFTDMFSDLTVMAAVTIAAVYTGLLDGTLATLFIFLYIATEALSYLRNSLGKRIRISFRPRMLLYAVLFLFFLTGIDYINEIILISSAIMIVLFMFDFIIIRRALK